MFVREPATMDSGGTDAVFDDTCSATLIKRLGQLSSR
jgi:hypothetical protein